MDKNSNTSEFKSDIPEGAAAIRLGLSTQVNQKADVFRVLIENSKDFVGISAPDGGSYYINPAGQQLLGVESKDVTNFMVVDYLAEEERERAMSEIFPQVKSQGFWDGRIFFKHFITGEKIPVSWNIFSIPVDETGGVGAMACVSRDLRERDKRDQIILSSSRALQEERAKLAAVVAVAKIGFYDWDVQADRITFSDQMRGDWMIDSSCTLAQALAKIHSEDRKRVEQALNETLKNQTPFFETYRILRADNKIVWIEARGETTCSPDGTVQRFFGTSLDVTERKAHEQMLLDAHAAAARANETKSSFLANMSHEIRTPLGAILGFTELLKEKNLSAEDRGQYLDTISRNGKALTRIIDDILDLAKVESGKLEIERIEFSLLDLIDDVMDIFREQTRSKGIYIRVDVSEEVPTRLLSDPTRLRQILINIIGNAVKFTDAGGITICLSTAANTSAQVNFRILVRDTGIGLSEDQRQRLFEPFMQADNSTTRKFGGTGLGLVLSKRLAKALGGDIAIAECELNKGCTFIITFVAELPENSLALNREPSEGILRAFPYSLANIRILLADDSKDNQILARLFLTQFGATVDTSENGSEAVKMALSSDYDIILMDIQMPIMDGYDATRTLRNAGYQKPIIALTAHAMSEARARTKAAGCDGHLTKPLDRNQLVKTIGYFARNQLLS